MIRLEAIGIRQGAFALAGIDLAVPAGQYTTLMGPTGSGKTSLLEVIAGLRRPAAGRVWLRNRDVTDTSPGERNIGYVPQDGALFKTMRVSEQLAFALVIRREPRPAIHARVTALAGELGIAHLLDRQLDGLSGGERQRVALGRALAFRPDILLLDEPLGALDDDTAGDIGALLKRIQHDSGVTVLHVTHRVDEARRLGDRMVAIRDGRITPGA